MFLYIIIIKNKKCMTKILKNIRKEVYGSYQDGFIFVNFNAILNDNFTEDNLSAALRGSDLEIEVEARIRYEIKLSIFFETSAFIRIPKLNFPMKLRFVLS